MFRAWVWKRSNAAINQFGGAFDGSAGPIRSVAGRTCDVLPMIARAAEILHAALDLPQRTARLLLRLELSIQGPAVDLARFAERALDRADYRRLCEAGMTTQEMLAGRKTKNSFLCSETTRANLQQCATLCSGGAQRAPPGRHRRRWRRTSSSPARDLSSKRDICGALIGYWYGQRHKQN
jgi:hypothetical protein